MNEELLISLVQKYPESFNHEDPHYHDDQRRMNIWEEIGRIMNETPLACKEKWKKIRENYRKAINLRKTKSGQGAKNFKLVRRFWLSHLEKKYSHDRQEEKDPTVEFFTNMGQTVKTFPPHLRVRVKRAVFNIVSEAEEEMIPRDA
ncbi:unnamed protein product [Parnassius apollo]|uniref:(apollo) hypothetical protein n=1 Tax=Parnassius apollo TaxID=110799 RepID=A0A8S3YFG2_PARAO|nr:unnamed protein product [Parnassius apollo]